MYNYKNTLRSDVSGLMLIFMLQGLIYQCVFSFRPWTRSLPSNPVTVFIHGLFSSFQYIHAQASNIFSSVGVSVSLFFNRARSRVWESARERVSIQTALTCRTILAEKRRKKNKSKKAFLFLLVEEANWAGHQMEIDGIGICLILLMLHKLVNT